MSDNVFSKHGECELRLEEASGKMTFGHFLSAIMDLKKKESPVQKVHIPEEFFNVIKEDFKDKMSDQTIISGFTLYHWLLFYASVMMKSKVGMYPIDPVKLFSLQIKNANIFNFGCADPNDHNGQDYVGCINDYLVNYLQPALSGYIANNNLISLDSRIDLKKIAKINYADIWQSPIGILNVYWRHSGSKMSIEMDSTSALQDDTLSNDAFSAFNYLQDFIFDAIMQAALKATPQQQVQQQPVQQQAFVQQPVTTPIARSQFDQPIVGWDDSAFQPHTAVLPTMEDALIANVQGYQPAVAFNTTAVNNAIQQIKDEAAETTYQPSPAFANLTEEEKATVNGLIQSMIQTEQEAKADPHKYAHKVQEEMQKLDEAMKKYLADGKISGYDIDYQPNGITLNIDRHPNGCTCGACKNKIGATKTTV